MRKIGTILMGCALGAMLISCDNNDGPEPTPDELIDHYKEAIMDMELADKLAAQVGDYADIMKLHASCVAEERLWKDKHEKLTYNNSYLDVRVRLKELMSDGPIVTKRNEHHGTFAQYRKKIHALSAPYFEQQKTWAKDNMEVRPVGDVWYYTARLTGNVTITADKKLFGKEPGEDLSQYFRVRNCAQAVYTLEDDMLHTVYAYPNMPTSVEEYFCKGSLLAEHYVLYLAEVPEETYDELTYSIAIPVQAEYWFNHMIAQETDPDAVMPTRDITLTASATLKLGTYSTFQEYGVFHLPIK